MAAPFPLFLRCSSVGTSIYWKGTVRTTTSKLAMSSRSNLNFLRCQRISRTHHYDLGATGNGRHTDLKVKTPHSYHCVLGKGNQRHYGILKKETRIGSTLVYCRSTITALSIHPPIATPSIHPSDRLSVHVLNCPSSLPVVQDGLPVLICSLPVDPSATLTIWRCRQSH